ncbi:TspO/MBR family-domain-containing protein [Ochromonadaceae sp. CCMP2298]|nr:TspO/MBR family-domain-containing protein [Ochromonadaceae sp. CCMP2298]|mmetsp:Transcript_4080/g.9157  ORF Transcript_4080/g.9157 Transcript_4080/m.9157 type:complete len:310 (+) Transcript_4080:59-988(+)
MRNLAVLLVVLAACATAFVHQGTRPIYGLSAANLSAAKPTQQRLDTRLAAGPPKKYGLSAGYTAGNPITQPVVKKTFSPAALASYVGATVLEIALIRGVLGVAGNRILPVLNGLNIGSLNVGNAAVVFLMLFMSLRSRIFSPLDNSRPKKSGNIPIFKTRKRPSWQPPDKAFPIIWSTISVLRAISGFLIYKTTGSVVSYPLMAFFAHLSIGDTWNTINNVDNRLGTSAMGILSVLSSVYYTTYQYYKTLPTAGYVLAPSCVWITIASALVWTIYRINYDAFSQPSLFPSKEEGPPSKWRVPLLSAFAK